MKQQHFFRQMFWLLLLLPAFANAQGTQGDYERASGLREKFQGLVVNAPDRANWIEKTSRFWYRKAVKGGHEFVLVDAETLAKKPAPRYNFPQSPDAKVSPDGKWEAWVNNFNIWVRPKGKRDGVALSYDGSEGNYYAAASLAWSPDSKMIAAYRVRPGYQRKLDYVESSPTDQLQPKYHTIEYAKPGDALDQPQPVLFNLETKKQIIVDNTLFPNPYQMSRLEWRKDSRAFTFEYNQRGHQVYRVIEVEAGAGKPRAVISEEPKTFFCYSGKKFRQDLADGREIVWMSERDGWNHLYLYDGATGKVKNQITKGEWVVRDVVKVDEEKRQIWFQGSGMYPGKDPYFVHYYRINFDGGGLTALTEADANHQVSFSSDMKYY